MMNIMLKGLWFLMVSGMVLLGCATDQASQPSTRKRAQAHEQLGTSFLIENNYQGALRELMQASELNPDSAAVQNSIGLAYLGLREYNSAVPHFKKALQLKPDFPEAQNNLGTTYARLKQWDAAIQYFEAAANNLLYRTRHLAYDNLGAAYHNKGDYRKAIDFYNKAIGYASEYAPAYMNRGLAHEMLSDWDAAIESYKKAAQIAPEDPFPPWQRGTLLLRLNRQEEAVQEFLAVIANDPNGYYGNEAKKIMDDLRKKK